MGHAYYQSCFLGAAMSGCVGSVLLSVSGEPAGAIILTATAPSSVQEEALAFETSSDPHNLGIGIQKNVSLLVKS